MKSRIKFMIFLISLTTTIVVVLILYIFRSNYVNSFMLEDYSYYIHQYSYDLCLTPVNTSRDARTVAEEVWAEIYDTTTSSYKPYIVSFDEENCVWLVKGHISNSTLGGVPYILIQEDGNVIAVWHDK